MGILIMLWYYNKEKYKILVCKSLLSLLFPHITMSQEKMTHAFKIKTFDTRGHKMSLSFKLYPSEKKKIF